MNERDFVYWLQGFLEIGDPATMTVKQVQTIKDHLALVLDKKTPARTADDDGVRLALKGVGSVKFCGNDSLKAPESLFRGEICSDCGNGHSEASSLCRNCKIKLGKIAADGSDLPANAPNNPYIFDPQTAIARGVLSVMSC